jgi:hypothetical protein
LRAVVVMRAMFASPVKRCPACKATMRRLNASKFRWMDDGPARAHCRENALRRLIRRGADQGAEVVLLARSEADLQRLCSQLGSGQRRRHAYLAVARSTRPLAKAFGRTAAATSSIHILVNNTGGPPGGLMYEAAPRRFIQAFAAHLVSSRILVQTLLSGMKNERFGPAREPSAVHYSVESAGAEFVFKTSCPGMDFTSSRFLLRND